MPNKYKLKISMKINILLSLILVVFLASCKNAKLPGGDARKFPDDPKLRVKKNLEEGRGFRLNDAVGNLNSGGTFEFASSNELWRASLDVIDFMPLASVNYSGGIIITDWYSSDEGTNETLKISIRFLPNKIRSVSLDIKIFTKKCDSLNNCVTSEMSGNLIAELKKEILKRAAQYKKENPDKKKNQNKQKDPNKIFG